VLSTSFTFTKSCSRVLFLSKQRNCTKC